MKSQYRAWWIVAGVLFVLFTIGLLLLSFAPSPWKQWGGFVVLVYVASTLVIRASQEIIGKFSLEWLPYVVATFIPITLVMLFASAQYGSIALIVLFVVTGIAAYYWFVAILIHETKKMKWVRWILEGPTKEQ